MAFVQPNCSPLLHPYHASSDAAPNQNGFCSVQLLSSTPPLPYLILRATEKAAPNFMVECSLVRMQETINFPDDWVETEVNLDIPTKSKDDQSISFSIPGFHYRPLVAVIRATFADVQANAFHLLPFKHLWKDPLDGCKEHVFDEVYSSDSWLQAQDDLQKQPKEPGCSLEHVIARLMFFSDATHLANFGMAKAWPLYLYFGNLSKYARSAPSSGACHIVGFLPLLPDSIKDILSSLPRMSKSGMAALHTHC
ncbi:hypothetical protein EV702DRAFT_1280579 [Suillus placidus]|uniref:Uncharacterized protein n=1 Tax=Suillus placidus TaxID=48579 RepID=A0A9P6ZRH0_9AGAM|nr:hypothetical protein EV702DRAFT_1280579 [Suillus placidus]